MQIVVNSLRETTGGYTLLSSIVSFFPTGTKPRWFLEGHADNAGRLFSR